MNQPVVTAQTYARWRATTLGSITERLETKVVFDLVGVLLGRARRRPLRTAPHSSPCSWRGVPGARSGQACRPIGKRGARRACEARLGVVVDDLHCEQIPHAWKLSRADLPCVLGRVGAERPFVVVAREEIMSCRGSASALEEKLIAVLSSETGGER